MVDCMTDAVDWQWRTATLRTLFGDDRVRGRRRRGLHALAQHERRGNDQACNGGHRRSSLWCEASDGIGGGITPTHGERRRQQCGEDDGGKRAH